MKKTKVRIQMIIQKLIDEIEDYVGGNIEGVKKIDRMSFTRFLRSKLEKAYKEGYRQAMADERALRPKEIY